MPETLIPGFTKSIASVTAFTASGIVGGSFSLAQADSYAFILDISTVTGTSPTFDVELEISPDGGTTFYAWARFAQLTAAGVRRLILQPIQGRGEAGTEAAITLHGSGALNANVPMPTGFTNTNVFQFYCTAGGTSPSATIKIWVVAAPRATAV
jgi:hypothetical protein